MAKIYNSVGGRKLTKHLAVEPGVQAELDARTFEIAVRAEEKLLEHRLDGHAEIDVEQGKVDHYVVLSDDRGDKAALSIEYGRRAYTTTREDADGNEFEVEIPGMDGLFILHEAANLPIKRRRPIKVKPQ
ncbi:DUF5403 family protein [Kribbella deserti]|uniref:DUF5403 family protein n=1 Tax=Kribbella deserti TaxID=1926257 RepID=A0ABV6QF41_9ACTN